MKTLLSSFSFFFTLRPSLIGLFGVFLVENAVIFIKSITEINTSKKKLNICKATLFSEMQGQSGKRNMHDY